ncbi:PREDICTED: LOW QUALITY PROTEIN: protein RETICULATA-RELATED 3, chloroplastic-like [Nicotiana attenuata]|uniref:LOW QUALITY PROTEIN: protein RETICULATA-RELATED 3, chloroplastic-like n=1 Tax=Nicotiana attenuata TaxID=49451 RepID=UPI000905368A|nr:PREDICTED: LOW QUALITY PROTEIN: protein RETICULATA-RELATED 3, chloroplastic-like [Nicotiana attenuata]
MVAMSQLCYTPLSGYSQNHNLNQSCYISGITNRFCGNKFQQKLSFNPLRNSHISSNKLDQDLLLKFQVPCAGGGDGGSIGIGRGGGGGGGGGDSGGGKGGDSDDSKSSWDSIGPIGAFVNGWRSRVAADPQFPFKVLMEELVGVSANVLGDMASRPNFGLNELDFVFSTLVVGSIMNFVLMYLLAPTASASIQTLPSIFANCPPSHMFQSGSYGLLSRLGTFVYKGTQFAAVGFTAGLVGTALSNGLIKMRKKMDPNFETPNKPPPTLLNAATWAIHMGFSSNLRYQTLNGVEFVLAKGLPPLVFKSSVVVLRCVNNLLGGATFVILAKMTGSQKANEVKVVGVEDGLVAEKERLLDQNDNMHTADSASK